MTIFVKTSKRALLALLIILMTTLAAEARVEFRALSYANIEIEKISDIDNLERVADEKAKKEEKAKKAALAKAELDKAENAARLAKAELAKAENAAKLAKVELAKAEKAEKLAKAEKAKLAKAELAKAEKAEKLAKAEKAELAKAELAKAEKAEKLAKAEEAEKAGLAKTELAKAEKIELTKTGEVESLAKSEKVGATKIERFNKTEKNSISVIEESPEVNALGNKKITREKIDRGIKMKTFMPKGTIFFGGTLSYTNLGATDYKFILFDNIKAQTTLIGVKVFAGYTFANNVAGGISFDYSRTLIRMDNVDIALSDDLNFGIKDSYSIQHIYTASAFLRAYINIGNSKRIGMFNDVKVYFSGGQGKVTSGIEQSPAFKGTYEKITKVGIVLQPGISVFATDFMTIEASIGIFGIEYSRSEQITNQVYQGTFESFNASFKLNLFSIGMGLAFYF